MVARHESPREALRRLLRRGEGQTAVEYTLIILFFGLPMFALCRMLLSILAEHYRMVTFLETLPCP
jgi:Flp pilus assembly pilin Flp